jgi:two-component system chemotaxis response regulator CheY
VLVADDDPAIRMLVQRVFVRRGYEVTTANDGADAIVQLEQNRYDLLVLDLMMPRVDGIGVIAHLQSRGAATPPILVMTAAAPDILRRLPQDRIARIITKPFDIEELMRDASEAIESARV